MTKRDCGVQQEGGKRKQDTSQDLAFSVATLLSRVLQARRYTAEQ